MGYWQGAWSRAPSSVIMAWVIGREHGVRLPVQSLWHGLLAESMESDSQLVIIAWVIGREHGVRLSLQLLWHGLLIACGKKIALSDHSVFTLTEMTGTPSTEPSARGEDPQAHNSHSHRKGGTASARQRYRKAKS